MTVSNSLSNTNPLVVRVFLVRHGQTDYNVKKILQGHIDIDVNSTGIDQAKKVGERFKSVPIDAVFSSDLIRCRNTTKEIIEHHPHLASKVQYTTSLRERNMGQVEGMHIADAIKKFGHDFRNLGEKEEDFVGKIYKFWELVLDESIEKNYSNCVLVTHGGVLTAFANYLHRNGYDLSPDLTAENLRVPFNTSVTVVDFNKETKQGTIQLFGETAHLGEQKVVTDQLLR